MKIKRKVQKNLPQLIEWAWENDVRDKVFWTTKDNRGVSYEACFSEFGSFYSDDILDSNVIFTVEVEEEIALTTPLPSMLHVWETEVLGREMREVENKSIASQYTGCSTEFWLKEDNKMTLIWRDGKLVD